MALPAPDLYDTLAKVRAVWEDSEMHSRDCGAALGPDPLRTADSSIRAGTDDGSRFWQMLQHLVNHGFSIIAARCMHHATQLGVPPPREHGSDRVLSRTRCAQMNDERTSMA